MSMTTFQQGFEDMIRWLIRGTVISDCYFSTIITARVGGASEIMYGLLKSHHAIRVERICRWNTLFC